MKIVLTNHALNGFGGTETWTYAMAWELSKKHDVSVFTNYKGKMSEKIGEFAHIIDHIESGFDLAIINHLTCYDKVPKNSIRIFTSHSILSHIESIERYPNDASAYVAVTEEVRTNQADGRNVHVIRNGIDMKRFSPIIPVNEKLKNVLYLAKEGPKPALSIVEEACQLKGVKLTVADTVFDVERLINENDLIITLGRGILEELGSELPAEFRDEAK